MLDKIAGYYLLFLILGGIIFVIEFGFFRILFFLAALGVLIAVLSSLWKSYKLRQARRPNAIFRMRDPRR